MNTHDVLTTTTTEITFIFEMRASTKSRSDKTIIVINRPFVIAFFLLKHSSSVETRDFGSFFSEEKVFRFIEFPERNSTTALIYF